MKTSIRRGLSVLAAVLIVMMITACAQTATTSSDTSISVSTPNSSSDSSNVTTPPEPFKIAYVAPMTGDYAQYGISMKNGLDIAVEMWNDAGGLNGQLVEVLTYDDKNDPKESLAVTQLAIEEDVIAVLGPFSSTCAFAMSPALIKAEIIHYALSASHPDITAQGIWVFRGPNVISGEINQYAEAAYEKLGARKVAVLYSNNDWGKSVEEAFAARFNALGGTITVVESFIDGQTRDFTPMLAKMVTSDPDVIFMGASYNNVATMLFQLENLNFDGQIITTSQAVSADFTPLIAGGHADGLIAATIIRQDNPLPSFQEFKKIYTERTQRDIDSQCIYGYDCTASLLYAVKQAGTTDKYAVRDALANLKDFDGCNGVWSFDENRDPNRPFVFLTMKDDEWVFWDGTNHE